MRATCFIIVVILLGNYVETRADLVLNGSFEEGTTQPSGNGLVLPNGSSILSDWTIFGGPSNDGVLWLSNGNSYGVSTPFGKNWIDLTGAKDQTPFFGVSQTLTTTVNQAYVLTFDLGVDNNNSLYSGPIGVVVTTGSSSTTISNYNPTGSGNIWQQFTVDFTATSTSTLLSIQGNQAKEELGVDNVSVIPASVPEPTSLFLTFFGGGSAGLICWIRGRRKN